MRKVILISLSVMAVLNVWQYLSSSFEQRSAYGAPVIRGNPISETASLARPVTTPEPVAASAAPITPLPNPTTLAANKLSAAGLNPTFASLYLQAEQATGTPWQLIAAVHQVETGQSGDTARTSYAGAVGPMQFLPATFRAYAVDGDGNGVRLITDVDDAVYSGGRYLAANGADRGAYSQALYGYNHSHTYVSRTLALARKLGL